jgi:hypothetical protein
MENAADSVDMTPKSSQARALQQFPELSDKVLDGRIRVLR